MNKAFFLRKEDRNPRWIVIDAAGKTLGRLTTDIVETLRGKKSVLFTPHTDAGDYVVIINAAQVAVTGKKMEQKIYERYTGYIGNRIELTMEQVMKKHPERIIEHAVKGMLPKNRLSRQLMRKLRVYAGDQHPHQAQV
ncbi:50S ribosomal protein L13 [Candidatus Dependentiae bacterium]|nr:50S ribosomal protein L13 [Candidatus Dependentiae bacterium]